MTLSAICGRLSRRLGFYEYLRYSSAYDFLLRWKNPAYLQQLQDDLRFYRILFRDRQLSLIFDVGANVGDKSWVFRQLANRVVCFEPDAEAARTLHLRYRGDPRIIVEATALSSSVGTATLYTEGAASAYNTLSLRRSKWVSEAHASTLAPIEVRTSTLDVALAKYGVPEYIKLDVEGHERHILEGLSSRIPLISFEANLPFSRADTLAILERLSASDRGVRYAVRIDDTPFRANDFLSLAAIADRVKSQNELRSWEMFCFQPAARWLPPRFRE